MALHKNFLADGFLLPNCEKHFHDSDETWVVLAGRGTAYWIDHEGNREEFELEAGDVWLVPAGYEHGSDGIADSGANSADFKINVFFGTEAPGSHEVGHYYMEQEGYIPSFELKKTPTDRYAGAAGETAA
jgi:Cupin domain